MFKYFLATLVCCLVVLSLQNFGVESVPCSSQRILVRPHVFHNSSSIDDFQLIYASTDNQIVFVRTRDGNIWRSTDEGESWVLQTIESKMEGISGTQRKISLIIQTDEENGKRKLYFLGSNYESNGQQKLWTSDDGGATYQWRRNSPGNLLTILPHPFDQKKAIAIRGRDKSVHLTRDLGATWQQIYTPIVNNAIRWGFPNEHPDRLYALVGGAQNTPWYQKLVYSDDFMSTYQTVIEQVQRFALRNDENLIVFQYFDQNDFTRIRLMLSDDTGKSWNVAEFPNEGIIQKEEKGWAIYDTSEDSVFTLVVRDFVTWWGDIYKSNAYDKDFSLSLRYHRIPDFAKFESVEGIYVANQWNVSDPSKGPKYNEDDTVTKITFNKGATWHKLRPPATKFNGQPYNCEVNKGCSLHLHGFSGAPFTWFYSVPNAAGLMLATGNVGDELESRLDEVNTYFSRDAGLTWEEVAQGAYVPEFGDHGGVIILAPAMENTDHILYSLNEGLTWEKCEITGPTESLIDVTNIRVSPNWNSKEFILYGTQGVDPIVVALDFKDLMGPCKAEDYEMWSPQDEHGHCILGEKVEYKRRKRTSKCWNGEQFERQKNPIACQCYESDYECDFCFEYDDKLDKCVFDCYGDSGKIHLLPLHPAGACQGKDKYYEVSMGYRKVEDNKCDETKPASVKLSDLKGLVPCDIASVPPPKNGNEPNSNTKPDGGNVSTLLMVAIALLVIGAIVAIFFLLYSKNDKFRQCFGGKPLSEGYVPQTLLDDNEVEGGNSDEEVQKA